MTIKKKVATPIKDTNQVMLTATETHKAIRIRSSRGHDVGLELWEHCPGEMLVNGVSGELIVKQLSPTLLRISVKR